MREGGRERSRASRETKGCRYRIVGDDVGKGVGWLRVKETANRRVLREGSRERQRLRDRGWSLEADIHEAGLKVKWRDELPE